MLSDDQHDHISKWQSYNCIYVNREDNVIILPVCVKAYSNRG